MRKMMFNISRFAPALFLAAGMLVAGEGYAIRACSELPSISGRTPNCSEALCIQMQDAVKAADACGDRFGAEQPKSCRRSFGCTLNQQMKQRFINCRDRRNAINATCWGGGDDGHRQAANDANTAAENCSTIIALPQSQGGCAEDPCE